MASMLCLAHYCDTHGPTPLMVTEGLPVPCAACAEEEGPERDHHHQPRSDRHHHPLGHPDDLENIRRMVGRAVAEEATKDVAPPLPPPQAQPQQQTTSFSSAAAAAMDTPPESPRLATLQVKRSGSQHHHHHRDSSFRKTYDENDRKRAIPCENCALTLPKKVKEQMAHGTSGSPPPTRSGGKADSIGPVLRTRKPYERISHGGEGASPRSTSSDSDEAEPEEPARPRGSLRRTTTCSSVSSFASSGGSQSHTHYLDYTSTHDPISSASFSILRASCLRTLSCETLPPNSAVASPSTPTSPLSWQPHRAFPAAAAATLASTSGGPIFFGDPQAGYTTAYIFRIPDPYARGRRRVYAFICLSSAHERTAMRAFSFLNAAFRDLASWIQSLADAEADRLDASAAAAAAAASIHFPEGSAPASLTMAASPSPSPSPFMSQPASVPNPPRRSSSPPSPRTTTTTQNTSFPGGADDDDHQDRGKRRSFTTPPPPPPLRTSAFLAGRPCDPDGFPRRGLLGQLRSRGLAELVGRGDFFIELHARFVGLLAQLAILHAGSGSGS